MATREFNFTVGPETSTQPAVGTPAADDDLLTRAYADARYLLGAQSINKLGDAAYTITDSDGYDVIMVGQSANMTANRTVTLPTAADNDERRLRVVKADATVYTVTVDGEGSEVVGPNAATSQTLTKPGEYINLICDGVKWHVIGRGLESFAPVEAERVKDAGDADYTITDVDGYDTIVYDTTLTADRTVTLPTVADNKGRRLLIKRNAAGAFSVIVDGESSETIDGATTVNLRAPKQTLEVICDGAQWLVIAEKTKSIVRVHTGNGHGSTNTAIRRFTTAEINHGNAITYADSAGNGASFTINQDGLYYISFTDSRTDTNQANIGASLNSAQLTTDVESITVTDRLFYVNTRSGNPQNPYQQGNTVAWLSINDVVRPHTNGANDAADARTVFHIAKL